MPSISNHSTFDISCIAILDKHSNDMIDWLIVRRRKIIGYTDKDEYNEPRHILPKGPCIVLNDNKDRFLTDK